MSELKLNSHCNSNAKVCSTAIGVGTYRVKHYYVKCLMCGKESDWHTKEEKAIISWNRVIDNENS